MKKNKKNNAVRLNFFDTENYESMISEIEIFKEKHKKIAVVIFDEEDRELTETLNNYKSCFKSDFDSHGKGVSLLLSKIIKSIS